MRLFSDLAAHYFQLENRRATLERDTRGLLEFFAPGSRVLDLGCGTGEHVAVLRKAGLDCEGLDIAPDMIALARERFGDHFRVADFRDMPAKGLQGRYAGCFSLFGSFGYLPDDAALVRALRVVAALLASGGLFVVEVWHRPPYESLKQPVVSPSIRLRVNHRVLVRERRAGVERRENRLYAAIHHRYFAEEAAGETFEETHLMRVFTVDEFRALAETAGLELIQVLGDVGGGVWRESGNGLVLVLRK